MEELGGGSTELGEESWEGGDKERTSPSFPGSAWERPNARLRLAWREQGWVIPDRTVWARQAERACHSVPAQPNGLLLCASPDQTDADLGWADSRNRSRQ